MTTFKCDHCHKELHKGDFAKQITTGLFCETCYNGGLWTTVTTDEAAALREQVAALTAEVNEVTNALVAANAKNAYARELLSKVYAERDNARDDADALRNRYRAARKIAARRRVERRELVAQNAQLREALEVAAYFLDADGNEQSQRMAASCFRILREGNQSLWQTAPVAAPVAAQPAPCRTCGGTRVITRYADAAMDSYSIVGTNPQEVPCPDCAPECEACDGLGFVTVSVSGEWEEHDCPDCDGTGARRETRLYRQRMARREADRAAARIVAETIPF